MKKNVIVFLIIAVIFTGVGAFANNLISADQIEYDSNNTVKDKIDDLYIAATKEISFGTSQYNQNQGNQTTRSTSLVLNKGEYIVAVIDSKGSYTSSNNTNTVDAELPITCTNSCTIQKLTGKHYTATATTAIYNSNYLLSSLYVNLYYVKVTNNTDTITFSVAPSANAKVGHSIVLQAIPIDY